MRALVLLYVVACGAGTSQSATTPPQLMHSPELNHIMKSEVNQPFSALEFMVFHAEGGDLDYTAIGGPAEMLRAGIARVRAIVDPPVQTNEARSVFFTFVENLARDADRFSQAVARRDRAGMESSLNRISETCNNCHHFFRLSIADSPQRSLP